MFLVFVSYRLLGLRIVLLMQGAGPLTSPVGRWLACRVLNRVELALMRDRGSFTLVEGLRSRAQLRLCHDGIFLEDFAGPVSAEETRTIEELVGDRDGRPLILVNLRLWFHLHSSWIPYQFAQERYLKRAAPQMEQLKSAVAGEISRLRDRYNARIVLVSMYEPEVEPWEDDLEYLKEIKTGHFSPDGDVRVLEAPLGIPAFFTLMGSADLAIGMRLHSTLIALAAGVPAVHLSYTLKGADIFAHLGLADLALPLDAFTADPAQLASLVDGVLADPDAKSRVAAAVGAAREANRQVLDTAFRELLGKDA